MLWGEVCGLFTFFLTRQFWQLPGKGYVTWPYLANGETSYGTSRPFLGFSSNLAHINASGALACFVLYRWSLRSGVNGSYRTILLKKVHSWLHSSFFAVTTIAEIVHLIPHRNNYGSSSWSALWTATLPHTEKLQFVEGALIYVYEVILMLCE